MNEILQAWGAVFNGIKNQKCAWGAAAIFATGLAAMDALLLLQSVEESAAPRMLFFWHPLVSEPPEGVDWLLSGAALIIPFLFRLFSTGYVWRLSPFVIGRLFRGVLVFFTTVVWMQLGLLFDGFSDWLFIVAFLAVLMIMYGGKKTHGN